MKKKQAEEAALSCLNCGKPFRQKRSNSRFCSTRCHKIYYQRGYNAEKRGTACQYNDEVICGTRACAKCGWNPTVAADRIRAIKSRHAWTAKEDLWQKTK